MNIDGSVAVISGGASGLGEACARILANDGCRVSLLDLNEEQGENLVSELGDRAIFCKVDVTDESAVQSAIDRIVDTFSGIHIVVNCAGTGAPSRVLGKEGPLSMETFRMVVNVNLFGTMNVIRAAAQQICKNEPDRDNEKGVVVNTASNAAFDGQIGQASYSASKAAIVGMTLPIAREFAEYGIRVNTVAPGLFDTPLLARLPEEVRTALAETIPFPKRMGDPVEFAMLVKHIIENGMINGETIRLDGALRMAAK